jgi:hypothetical protein
MSATEMEEIALRIGKSYEKEEKQKNIKQFSIQLIESCLNFDIEKLGKKEYDKITFYSPFYIFSICYDSINIKEKIIYGINEKNNLISKYLDDMLNIELFHLLLNLEEVILK